MLVDRVDFYNQLWKSMGYFATFSKGGKDAAGDALIHSDTESVERGCLDSHSLPCACSLAPSSTSEA